TGTLTRNEMTVREIAASGARYAVSGAGYAPQGSFAKDGATLTDPRAEADLMEALAVGAWCNNARVAPDPKGGGWRVNGDPTEGALIVAARKAGIEIENSEGARPRVLYEIPFDSERKRMSVVL